LNDIFIGFVVIEDTLIGLLLSEDADGTPKDADVLPTFRVYGNGDFLISGVCSLIDTGTITGATNVNPIVVTSVNHGLTNGTLVTVSGVVGNTAANVTAVISGVTDDTFTLTGVAGNGAYTSGGSWHVAGAYEFEIDVAAVNDFASGIPYQVLFTFVVDGTTQGVVQTFQVA